MGTSSSKSKEPKPSAAPATARKKDPPAATSSTSPAPAPAEAQSHTAQPKPAADEGAELTTKYGRGFASEVALLQMMDGGSTAHNIERVLKKRAKQARSKKRAAASGVVSDGTGLYVDEQEREEHRRLLPRDGGKM